MNFFERQEVARRKTGVLVGLFAAGTTAIVTLVVVVVGALFATAESEYGSFTLPSARWYADNLDIVLTASLITLGFIGIASMVRSATLSAGGGRVAQQLGGTPVSPDTKDPLRRRLRNVVEEMAIASGVPVPEIYVLENEAAINAFAAGTDTGNAAVAVTRGTLERLNRTELQGVIAHEFSHILNGDMRLNLRLVGILFGLLALGLVGRIVLRGTSRGSSRNGKGASVVLILGLALFILGYVGVFFGRLVKAAVSRQREYLADASAVQFTRDTEGIAGALKKIGGYTEGSALGADSEEFSHMLFALGSNSLRSLFATHPPLADRIRAIDPAFREEEFDRIRSTQAAAGQPQVAAFAGDVGDTADAPPQKTTHVDATPELVASAAGNPGTEHVKYAAGLRQAIPERVYAAAHSPDGAVVLLLALLLDRDESVRSSQTALLAQRLGAGYRDSVTGLYEEVRPLGDEYRLPLLDLAFPTLKNRPQQQMEFLGDLATRLTEVDARVEPFEYAFIQLVRGHLGGRTAGKPVSKAIAVQTVLSVLAQFGNDDTSAAEAAYRAGMESVLRSGRKMPAYTPMETWARKLDAALERLRGLPPRQKGKVVEAMTLTAGKDGRITTAEAELLRAMCAAIGVPLPPFLSRIQTGRTD